MSFANNTAMLQGELLTPKEVALVEHILAGQSIKAAADLADMAHGAAYAACGRPRVRDAILGRRAQVFDQIVQKIANAATSAVDVLLEITLDKKAAPTARVAAARALIDNASKTSGDAELQHLIAEVESRLAALGDSAARRAAA